MLHNSLNKFYRLRSFFSRTFELRVMGNINFFCFPYITHKDDEAQLLALIIAEAAIIFTSNRILNSVKLYVMISYVYQIFVQTRAEIVNL